MMAEHSKLLVDDLKADEAQRKAIVRDDVRNLVIAGAGSGKTRTIVGRIRFLLERKVPPPPSWPLRSPTRPRRKCRTDSGRWEYPSRIAKRGVSPCRPYTRSANGSSKPSQPGPSASLTTGGRIPW